LKTPTYKDIESAYKKIKQFTIKTPLLESDEFNQEIGSRVLIKAECLQKTGSFKFRGALNSILNIEKSKLKDGIICYSSGNHAQAVAYVSKILGLESTVVMPATAPEMKVEKARSYGGKVIIHQGDRESMEFYTNELALKTKSTLIKPFDDFNVIAGQGTVGIEIAEQTKKRKIDINSVLVPCSGGGLTAGIAIALSEKIPNASIHPVEPKGYEDTALSLKYGKIIHNSKLRKSICDALLVPKPGKLTFNINKKYISKGLVISDQSTKKAMSLAYKYFKIVLEPGGAISLAAAINKDLNLHNKTIVVVASGGNVDEKIFSSAILNN
tara:strand:- start:365 stop:1342 length:978 start_codon:yes stop_codon:yes gene_type:complete